MNQIEDVKAKLAQKDSQLKNSRQMQDKLELVIKEKTKEVSQSAKQASTFETELIQQQEKHAALKKKSQQLQYTIDNLKISKEQQALAHEEKLKDQTENENEVDRLNKVV